MLRCKHGQCGGRVLKVRDGEYTCINCGRTYWPCPSCRAPQAPHNQGCGEIDPDALDNLMEKGILMRPEFPLKRGGAFRTRSSKVAREAS